jgi:hypothetical protein
MRGRFFGVLLVLSALAAVCAASAAAEPATFPRGVVDQSYTATRSNAPTGVGFSGRYHAAGDEAGNPPYMRRMVFQPPRGFRYDTSVPEACTANDFELAFRGPEACPAGSKLGEGTTEGIFYAPFSEGNVILDEFVHHIELFNNTNEQIILIQAEGWAVVRGKFQPDGSLVFDSPTCFPQPPTGCADDHVLQLATTSAIAPYTRVSGRRTLSYARTPRECPRSGSWETTIGFWWADGAQDSVVTTQPCRRK